MNWLNIAFPLGLTLLPHLSMLLLLELAPKQTFEELLHPEARIVQLALEEEAFDDFSLELTETTNVKTLTEPTKAEQDEQQKTLETPLLRNKKDAENIKSHHSCSNFFRHQFLYCRKSRTIETT